VVLCKRPTATHYTTHYTHYTLAASVARTARSSLLAFLFSSHFLSLPSFLFFSRYVYSLHHFLGHIARTLCVRGLLLHMSYTAWSVCVCLCVGHIHMSSPKTAEPIEMPFGGRLVGLGNLDDSTHTISRGMCQHNIVKHTDSTTHYAKYGIIHCLIPA